MSRHTRCSVLEFSLNNLQPILAKNVFSFVKTNDRVDSGSKILMSKFVTNACSKQITPIAIMLCVCLSIRYCNVTVCFKYRLQFLKVKLIKNKTPAVCSKYSFQKVCLIQCKRQKKRKKEIKNEKMLSCLLKLKINRYMYKNLNTF